MKRILVVFLLSVGIFYGATNANAEAYVGDTDSIQINAEANKKAIEILKSKGDLDDSIVPLDKLTTETPKESNTAQSSFKAYRIRTKKIYVPREQKFIYGMYQYRIDTLAPVGFNWSDNGIPVNAFKAVGFGPTYRQFDPEKVWDTGVGGYNLGYYWRLFGTPWGSFWASAWNIDHLIYN